VAHAWNTLAEEESALPRLTSASCERSCSA
jgi:hypothetical protein